VSHIYISFQYRLCHLVNQYWGYFQAATVDTFLAPEVSLPDQTFNFGKIAEGRYSTKKM